MKADIHVEIDTGEADEGFAPPVQLMKRALGFAVTVVPNGIMIFVV